MKQFSILNYWQTFIWFTGILYLSFAPKDTFDVSLYLFKYQDKVIHLCLYVGLAFLFLRNTKTSYQVTNKIIISTFFTIVCISGLIEILQPILSNRTKEFLDLVANSIGAILGIGLFKMLPLLKRK